MSPFGHSIRILLERYIEVKGGGREEEDLLRDARELDRHYIPSRYPSAHLAGTPHEAYDKETSKRALEAAERIVLYARRELRVE